MAQWAQRCGQDYQTNYNAFVKAAANGNCANIVGVRDKNQLYNQCLPVFKTLPCSGAGGVPTLPASCDGQLLQK